MIKLNNLSRYKILVFLLLAISVITGLQCTDTAPLPNDTAQRAGPDNIVIDNSAVKKRCEEAVKMIMEAQPKSAFLEFGLDVFVFGVIQTILKHLPLPSFKINILPGTNFVSILDIVDTVPLIHIIRYVMGKFFEDKCLDDGLKTLLASDIPTKELSTCIDRLGLDNLGGKIENMCRNNFYGNVRHLVQVFFMFCMICCILPLLIIQDFSNTNVIITDPTTISDCVTHSSLDKTCYNCMAKLLATRLYDLVYKNPKYIGKKLVLVGNTLRLLIYVIFFFYLIHKQGSVYKNAARLEKFNMLKQKLEILKAYGE